MNKIYLISLDLLIYTLPVWLFLLLFFFYGYGETSPVMLNKMAGLLSLLLIGITFLIGPLSYFFPNLFNHFKTYRKYLGISGFVTAIIHAVISYFLDFQGNLTFMFLDPNNEDLFGVYIGSLAIGIFLLMTITSTNRAIKLLGFRHWKILQTSGYFALFLVMFHFILMETSKGVKWYRLSRRFFNADFLFDFNL